MVSSRFPALRSAFLAVFTAWVVAAVCAPQAGAAVAYRQQTCKSQTFLILGSFSMNKPAGVVSGDVLVASMRVSSFLSFNFSTPSGWNELGVSDNNAKLYYKVAGASEPGSYNFGSMIGLGATMIGTIVAFSGVDTANPFADSAVGTGSGTAVSIPNVTSVRNGSVLYSNVTSGAGATSAFSGLLTDACDLNGGGVSVSNAFASVAAGVTATVTDTLSSSTSWVAQALVLQPASPCTTGGLALTLPGTISFGSIALDGTNKTATTVGTLGVGDMTDTAVGWNVSATSTRFTSGGNSLANTATTITGLAVTAGATNCGMPTASGLGFPMTLPAGATAPAAIKIYSAIVGSGLGLANLGYTFALAIPANTRIGTYTSTWTFTLSSGP